MKGSDDTIDKRVIVGKKYAAFFKAGPKPFQRR